MQVETVRQLIPVESNGVLMLESIELSERSGFSGVSPSIVTTLRLAARLLLEFSTMNMGYRGARVYAVRSLGFWAEGLMTFRSLGLRG